MRKAALLYTGARFGLFLLVALLVFLATNLTGSPVNGLPLVLVAAVVSSVVGYFLFARQREQLARALEDQRAAKTASIAARRARLDAER